MKILDTFPESVALGEGLTPIPTRKTVEEVMIGKRLQLEERGAR